MLQVLLLVPWRLVIKIKTSTTLPLVCLLLISKHSSLKYLTCWDMNISCSCVSIVSCSYWSWSLFRLLLSLMRLSSSMHYSISKCLRRHHSSWISALFLRLATSCRLMSCTLLNVFSHDLINWSLWINLNLTLLVILTDLSCLVDWTSRFLRTQFPCTSIPKIKS